MGVTDRMFGLCVFAAFMEGAFFFGIAQLMLGLGISDDITWGLFFSLLPLLYTVTVYKILTRSITFEGS